MVNWPNFRRVRCKEQRNETVAAGPAHDEGKTIETGRVQCTRHADERGCAHPVGAGRHAVEERRHASPGHVIFGHVRGSAHDADSRVQANGREQEEVAEDLVRDANLLEDGEDDDECR